MEGGGGGASGAESLKRRGVQGFGVHGHIRRFTQLVWSGREKKKRTMDRS